jgi:hypothetical protein
LLDDVAAEPVFIKRKALFRKVVLRMQEQAHLIPLYCPVRGWGWSNKLKNFNPIEYYQMEKAFTEAWLDA